MTQDTNSDLEIDLSSGEPVYKYQKKGFSHFNALTASLDASILILKDWKVQWCNDFTEKMFDRKKVDLINILLESLFKSHDDFENILSLFQSGEDTELFQLAEFELTRSDKTWFKAELTLGQITENDKPTGELLAIIRESYNEDWQLEVDEASDSKPSPPKREQEATKNILDDINLEYRAAKEALQAMDEKYMSLVNRTRDGIVIIQDKLIKFTDPRFTDMIGYNKTELEGRAFTELIPQQSAEGFKLGRQEGDDYTKIGAIFESKLVTKSTKPLPVEIDSCPIFYEGAAADMVIVRDLTEQKTLETELVKKNNDLNNWNQRVMEATQLKAQFMANMSHELRAPINSIIGYSEMVLNGVEGPLTVSQRESLTRIINNSNHLLNLINDILDLAKITSGRLKLNPQKIDLRVLVSDIIPTYMPQFDSKGLKLEYTRPDELPNVYADPDKINQVFTNLITNAIKFTKVGSIGIEFEDLPKENAVKVMVWDTGIGIPDENKPEIFNEFHQVDGVQSRKYFGTGLGLAISKYIVELLGGRIWVDDNTDFGSRFYFTLPKTQHSGKTDYTGDAPY
jgi:PAS domain S-box-containing protein